MRSDRLIINDIDIDLDSKSVIAISSAINDLKNLTDHDSGLSNRFKVPRTLNNENALGNPDQVGSSSVIPYRKNTVQYIKDGVNIVQNGYAVVESSSDSYAITIYYGNTNFFSIIEGLKLTDLDLSSMDHIFDSTTVIASTSFDYSTGYKYPLIDYGQLDNNTRTVDPSYFRLAVFIRYVFEFIIAQAGFLLEAAFKSGARFSLLMLTTDNDNKGHQYYDTLNRFTFASPQTLYNTWGSNPAYNTVFMKLGETWSFSITIIIKVTDWVPGSGYLKIGVDLPNSTGSAIQGYVYTHVDASGNGTFTITQSWTSFNGNTFIADGYFHIHIYNRYCKYECLFGELTGTKSGSTTPDLFIHIPPVSFFTTGVINWAILGIQDIYIGFDLLTQYGYTTIRVNRQLPNMTQKDFIKAIAQMYQLMFKTSSTENKIYIKQFSEIVDSIKDAKDWSGKLHWQKHQHLSEFRIGDYSQTNHMRFKHDDSDKLIPDEYGDGAILVDDQTLATENDSVNLPFAASLNQKKCLNWDVPSVRRIDDITGEWTVTTEPRLLIDDFGNITDGLGDIIYDDGVLAPINDVVAGYCYFQLNGRSFNAGFNDTLLEDNYTSLTRVLNKTRKITLLFRLSAVDIYQLDHFIPIYLKQLSAYFYINKVINWTGEDSLTKVELIRIGESNAALLE
jgi:hypothetical protein